MIPPNPNLLPANRISDGKCWYTDCLTAYAPGRDEYVTNNGDIQFFFNETLESYDGRQYVYEIRNTNSRIVLFESVLRFRILGQSSGFPRMIERRVVHIDPLRQVWDSNIDFFMDYFHATIKIWNSRTTARENFLKGYVNAIKEN